MENAIASKTLRAGRRTYFFSVKKTKDGQNYLDITESKHTARSEWYKQHVIVFAEAVDEFLQALATIAPVASKDGKGNQSWFNPVKYYDNRRREISQ